MEVLYVPEARQERAALDVRERDALDHAIEKLELGEVPLGHPHASRVRGADRIWELRPRAGRARHRAFFRIIHGTAVIGAVGPEALVDRRGFRRAVRHAEERLRRVEERA